MYAQYFCFDVTGTNVQIPFGSVFVSIIIYLQQNDRFLIYILYCVVGRVKFM